MIPTIPTPAQLKKVFLDSGFEVRHFPQRTLEQLALDAPTEVKRHKHSDIYGLIMPDEYTIGIAKELDKGEQLTTLVHELIHLYDDQIPEDEVEEIALSLEDNFTPEQRGFFEFLAA